MVFAARVWWHRDRLPVGAAAGGLDQLVHLAWPDGRHISLRRLVCDLIEEYGRHTGHADLLREAVDGRVGEDPPAGCRRPRAGSSASSGIRTSGVAREAGWGCRIGDVDGLRTDDERRTARAAAEVEVV
ncbi:DUF664 domain-containing protein [Nocardia arthritidis]|uniref:DUF664 domain-containing protein n=1 Tax=Nocardia arthritidis TaxID=228602 RepID=A0A6G9YIL4_9NOCA|nr:DUF664 domain-containing protein [Nocardia arthritidis]